MADDSLRSCFWPTRGSWCLLVPCAVSSRRKVATPEPPRVSAWRTPDLCIARAVDMFAPAKAGNFDISRENVARLEKRGKKHLGQIARGAWPGSSIAAREFNQRKGSENTKWGETSKESPVTTFNRWQQCDVRCRRVLTRVNNKLLMFGDSTNCAVACCCRVLPVIPHPPLLLPPLCLFPKGLPRRGKAKQSGWS